MIEKELTTQTETEALGKNVDLQPCSTFDFFFFFLWKLNPLLFLTVTLGQHLP